MQKVLIVEDEKAISGVLHSILSDELTNYEVLVAEDGLEAYKLIEKDDFALVISDIKNFIFHPGGKKVLTSYEEALGVEGDFLKTTREVMNNYGNMSSATVLYVLERFFTHDFEDGYGLMMSMGPGFSCEMVLLQMNK